ncbi:DUF6508 domain-containing protein [Pseudomonas syringae group sp. J309-1]|uniref:DUF6508 domain-containing protein n=1 Tax=Pseudomonas syringae group sp. J309-1 TaxID=3079588 RepID=UPI00290B605D|nr:DUF6508 domain-containing protein [Pseudomonas syringae group sp. J309-1]MDU8360739.1 DUF6508 domain-containing protein [Pseudomonas syringae group sp. J309-1]
MKLLDRLKAYFGHKQSPVEPQQSPVKPKVASNSPTRNEGEPLSRVAQNLSWLPVYEEPKPRSLTPPACPPISLDDTTLISRYEAWIAQAEQAEPHDLSWEFREAGRQLAGKLFSSVLDLSSMKGREGSEDIYWLLQSAAIASLFAEGPQSEAFLHYSKDVQSYGKNPYTSGQVQAFELYVASHLHKAELHRATSESAAPAPRPPSEPVPQAADMDELLAWRPRLYPRGVAIKTHVLEDRWPAYFDVVNDFYRILEKECWTDIDYMKHGAAIMLKDEAYIARASLGDIQTMLTLCLRGERFCDGHHGAVIRDGYVLNVLNRLAVLREGV